MTKQFYDSNGRPIPVFRELSTQVVAYTGTAGTSAALDARVRLVRVWCTTDAYIAVGAAPTAVATNIPLTAKVAEYFPISEGWKVSAKQISAGGNMHVTGLL